LINYAKNGDVRLTDNFLIGVAVNRRCSNHPPQEFVKGGDFCEKSADEKRWIQSRSEIRFSAKTDSYQILACPDHKQIKTGPAEALGRPRQIFSESKEELSRLLEGKTVASQSARRRLGNSREKNLVYLNEPIQPRFAG
jgi:hypothetical protein